MIADWGDAISAAWQTVIDKIINFIPNLLGALIILFLGWIVAVGIELLVDRILRLVGVQTLSEKAKIEDSLRKMGDTKDLSATIAVGFKWIIMLVAFIAAADSLKLTQVTDFLNRVLGYAPNVIAAAAILLIGVILAHFLGNVMKGVLKGAEIGHSDLASTIVRYSIIIFSFVAALVQLNVAAYMIQTLFTGLVALLAIAGGLAFGLGGKDSAAELLDKVKEDIAHNKKQ